MTEVAFRSQLGYYPADIDGQYCPGNIGPMDDERTYTAFAGTRLIAHGPLREMLPPTKRHVDTCDDAPLVIFDDQSGRPVDFDFRGSVEEVVERAAPAPRTGPGRPRLGVVSREVSLLPRHWEWLEHQPAGISAALRRLVEAAIRHEPAQERARRVREAVSNAMTVLAGNLPCFEEATRALFAGERARFLELIGGWPADVRDHIQRLSEAAFVEDAA